ncbi:MAG: EamA family transporter [Clostridia bacterium]|nr:EamA family transporter [Clostridia bacterium]
MKKKALLYIVIACVFWGSSCIFVNALAPFGFSSVQMVSMRGSVAAIGMMVYSFLTNRKLFKASLKEIVLFACSGLSMFGTASCYYMSMQISSVSMAVVLMYTAPVFVMVYSVLFLGERLTKMKLCALIGMLVGCCLVSGIAGGVKINIPGIVTGLASGIFYSAYNIFTKIQMRNRSNPVSASMYCFVFMSIIALSMADLPSMMTMTAQTPGKIIPLFIGIGVCVCLLPYFLYTLALKDLPAGTASALGILEPMVATVFSVVLYHEKLSVYSIFGIVLILGSVLLLSRSEAHGMDSGDEID